MRVDATAATLRRLGNVGTPVGGGLTYKKLVKGTSLLLFFTIGSDGILITRLRHVRENRLEDF